MKKVLVDCIAFTSAGTRSVGINMVRSLARASDRFEYYVLAPSGAGFEELGAKNVRIMTFPRKRMYYLWRIWFDQILVPKICKELQIDVFLNLINLPTRFSPVPQILAIHQSNLIAEIPYKMPFKDKLFFRLSDLLFRFGKGSVKYFVVQTPVMAENLRRRQSVDPQRIEIIKNGYEQQFGEMKPVPRIKDIFAKAKGVKALCLSRYYPNKNLEIFLKVAELAKKRGIPISIFITIENDHHPWAGRYLRQIKDLQLEDEIINLGYLSREEAATAYRSADLFVLPTLLESFGLIYLEAMGLGCPIATSDRDFARYVCGEAALYFDPRSPEEILDKLNMVHNDPRLREDLVSKGKLRLATAFKGWDEVAGEYLELVKKALCYNLKERG